MTKPYVQENFKDHQLQRFQKNLRTLIEPLRTGVFGDGNLVKDVATATGTIIVVNTGLKQPPQGWDLIRPRCTSYSATFTSMGPGLLEVTDTVCTPVTWDPDTQLAFLCFFDGFVDLWVY
jgi:hypothetical protein